MTWPGFLQYPQMIPEGPALPPPAMHVLHAFAGCYVMNEILLQVSEAGAAEQLPDLSREQQSILDHIM